MALVAFAPACADVLFFLAGFIAASIAILAGPAFVAVRKLTAHRLVAPLLRGSVELCAVVALSGFSAAALAVQLWALASALDAPGVLEMGNALLLIVPLVALAPWVAGEVMSGPSRRPFASAFGAIGGATTLAWAPFVHGNSWGPGALDLAAGALVCAALACCAYLLLRGPPSDAATGRSLVARPQAPHVVKGVPR